jgi:radical SAM superfamily enzyme YgiQ (UPF0313 family)
METGDDTVLRKCHKNFTIADLERMYKIFTDAGIPVFLLIIVGLPGETWDTVRRTGEVIRRLQGIQYNYYAAPNLAMVFPGTELEDTMIQAGIITDDFWMSDALTPVYTVEHPLEELEAMQNELLNYIDMDRLWTWKGFQKQWKLIPRIYWFKFWHFWYPRHILKEEIW